MILDILFNVYESYKIESYLDYLFYLDDIINCIPIIKKKEVAQKVDILKKVFKTSLELTFLSGNCHIEWSRDVLQ